MKRRPLLQPEEDLDPSAGLVNLFDVAMVFAVALMVALVSYLHLGELITGEDLTYVKNPGQADMEIITRRDGRIEKYSASQGGPSSGTPGRRVGTAYELDNGEIVYVPE